MRHYRVSFMHGGIRRNTIVGAASYEAACSVVRVSYPGARDFREEG